MLKGMVHGMEYPYDVVRDRSGHCFASSVLPDL
jgi:hypothetical protein